MNINKDLVTVIISAYNHEHFVRETIRSVINQTYKNIELIIVDDGSIDNTWNVIQKVKSKCKERFCRLVVEHQKNHGFVYTLNKSLKLAKGRYLYLLASDDIILPKTIEILHNNIGNFDMIFPDLSWIDSIGRKLYLDTDGNFYYKSGKNCYRSMHKLIIDKQFPDLDKPNFDFYGPLLRDNYINVGGLFRTQTIKDIGGWKGDGIEDYYMNLQLAKRKKIKRLKEVLFLYRRHGKNWSSDRKAVQKSVKNIFMQERLYCIKNGYQEIWNQVYETRYSSIWNDFLLFLQNVK